MLGHVCLEDHGDDELANVANHVRRQVLHEVTPATPRVLCMYSSGVAEAHLNVT